jgi:hypothetical protein
MWRFDSAKLAYWLRKRRRPQRWLAAKIGRGETDLSQIVNGWRPTPTGVVEAAAKALGVAVGDIATSSEKVA